MLKLGVFFFLTVACHENNVYGSPIISGRIVGEIYAQITDFPYQASVRVSGLHKCGGAIISPSWVVTAAHCTNIYTASQVSVYVGSNQYSNYGYSYNIQELVNHPSFSPSKMTNDISLIRIYGTFTLTLNVQPVYLIRSGVEVSVGTYATITGWGSTAVNGPLSVRLMKVDLPVVSQSQCDAIYGGITDGMLCAGYTSGGKDVCQGDYGGPLVSNGELIGIASWGDGCAQAGHPSVYTKISKFRSWIEGISGV